LQKSNAAHLVVLLSSSQSTIKLCHLAELFGCQQLNPINVTQPIIR
jgi:hypothetical protein